MVLADEIDLTPPEHQEEYREMLLYLFENFDRIRRILEVGVDGTIDTTAAQNITVKEGIVSNIV
jgi:hypothetical protein